MAFSLWGKVLPLIFASCCLSSSYTDSKYVLNRSVGNLLEPPPLNEFGPEMKIAGMNVKLQSITDSPGNLARYPQYAWGKRIQPLVSLILKDRPSVLALSETNAIQAQILKELFVQRSTDMPVIALYRSFPIQRLLARLRIQSLSVFSSTRRESQSSMPIVMNWGRGRNFLEFS